MSDLLGTKPPEALAVEPTDEENKVAIRAPIAALGRHAWMKAQTFGDFAVMCCGQPNLKLTSDPRSFSLAQRMGRMGPLAVADLFVGSDISIERGRRCDSYRVFVPLKGDVVSVRRDSTVTARPTTAAVLTPEDHTESHWATGTRMIAVRFDRCAVDDALSDAIGHQVRGPIDFAPLVPITSAATQSWVNMLMLLARQLFGPDNLLNQPLVGLPFVESLVRGFLLTANHPHREALAGAGEFVAPRTIRTAIEIMEQEAHLPLTLTSIAARSHASVRSLQQGFRHHLHTSPMAYLREVRLRRAHQMLLESNPSTVTVASVAYRWGFTNLGRFASAHATRYGEAPSATLHTASRPCAR
ncbi:AraC family transcriptional regulator [Mycobacterium sp. 1423905.2]|uniref:AraC family transcriptional regulator n=1 Tax=Mycobacterium sp. 1423905.2 TaxID=1856859 RepID=UPI0007FEFD3E|nr:AraC family transcriptional regulator [Mycobacterium sp. 1423905.2]OBJ54736.1 hypothetical protein A9W95_01360 [Mycobacterium sp. 1423905.2]